MKAHKDWLAGKRRKIEKAKELVSEMEKELGR
jgi:pentatricopeptide repeat protein